MKIRSAILPLALAVTTSAALASDANMFILVNAKTGKTVGKASYTIDKAKNGFKVRSKFEHHISSSQLPQQQSETTAVAGMQITTDDSHIEEGQISAEYKIDADGNFVSGFLEDTSTSTMTNYDPNKAHDAITVSPVANGSIRETHDIPLPKPVFLLAPDFDPAPIQVLITTALNHPHPDYTYLLVVPPDITTRPGSEPIYVTIQAAKDTRTGTLDGKPVTLKHYLMNYHVGRADLFIDDSGTLMEAQIGPLGVDYIRAKFVLAP
jgi:hypothetical protein